MSRVFYIVRDDGARWLISDDESGPLTGGGPFRSRQEALDWLGVDLARMGLVVDKTLPTPNGFRVETKPGGSAPSASMLYSPESLGVIEDLKWRLGRNVKHAALKRAESEGRTLITEDDVWAIIDKIDWAGLDEAD